MPRLALVELNFCVPEDPRVWRFATAARDAGWDVTVVCPALRGHAPGRQVVDDITVRYFKAAEGSGFLSTVAEAVLHTTRASRIVSALHLGDGDVVQVCNPPDTMPWLLRRLRRRGVRTVYDQHDVAPLLAASKPAHRPLAPLHALLERLTVRHADAVITAGSAQAQRLRRRYGVEPVVVRTAARDTSVRHLPRAEPSTVGYVGVLGSQDGVDRLVDAAAALRATRPGLRVRIAGDGTELPALREQVATQGLADVVELCGWVPAGELEDFLVSVDVLVVPDPVTAFNASCPMVKVSHALAVGLPVVLTPLDENVAIVGEHGVLATGDQPAEIADAIDRCLATTTEHRAVSGRALRARYDALLGWPVNEPAYLSALSGKPAVALDVAAPAAATQVVS
ncbi:MAG TPA: glycosyltransferase [Mycobacteriales bacterium]|nr:glycosyltransferase [Mycobacteriales bacterium]